MGAVREMAPGKESGAIKETNVRDEGLRRRGVRLRIPRGMGKKGWENNFHKLKSYLFFFNEEGNSTNQIAGYSTLLPDLLLFGADFLF